MSTQSRIATITMPLPPDQANARLHWATKTRKRKAYFRACDVICMAGQIPLPPDTPLDKATATVSCVVFNPHDDDNMMARIKWAVDWLVRCGYIVNDNPKHFRIPARIEQTVSRKKETEYTVNFIISENTLV